MEFIYIDSNGKQLLTPLTADILPFHTHDYEPKNENIQAHISNSGIHVTPEQTANFHGHSNYDNLAAYNPSMFALANHIHQWDKVNFTVNASALADGIPVAQAGSGGTLRKYIGTYLAQKTEIIKNLNDLTEKSYNSLTDKPDLSTLHSHSNKTVLDLIVSNGNGSQFLANDGTYKTIQGGSGVNPTNTAFVHSSFSDVAPHYSTIQSALTAGYTNIQVGEGVYTLRTDIDGVRIQGTAGTVIECGTFNMSNSTIDAFKVTMSANRRITVLDGINHINCIELCGINLYTDTNPNIELYIHCVIHYSNSYSIQLGLVDIHGSSATTTYPTATTPDKTCFIVGKGAKLSITDLRFAESFIVPLDADGNSRDTIFELHEDSHTILKHCRIVGGAASTVINAVSDFDYTVHLILDNCNLIGANDEMDSSTGKNQRYWNRGSVVKNGTPYWTSINNVTLITDSTIDTWN